MDFLSVFNPCVVVVVVVCVVVIRISGVVAYVGPVEYAKGIYVGVITDNPTDGKNNGIKFLRYALLFVPHDCVSNANMLYSIGACLV